VAVQHGVTTRQAIITLPSLAAMYRWGGDRLQYSVRHSAMGELAISPASSALHPVLLREGIVGRQKNKAIAFFDE